MDHDYQVYAADPAWVLVPVEPTEAMKQAGGQHIPWEEGWGDSSVNMRDAYAAMLAAAPPPPAGSDGWRDIGTFDKKQERARVLAWGAFRNTPDHPQLVLLDWVQWIGSFSAYALPFHPTHWQPLPEAPTPPVAPPWLSGRFSNRSRTSRVLSVSVTSICAGPLAPIAPTRLSRFATFASTTSRKASARQSMDRSATAGR